MPQRSPSRPETEPECDHTKNLVDSHGGLTPGTWVIRQQHYRSVVVCRKCGKFYGALAREHRDARTFEKLAENYVLAREARRKKRRRGTIKLRAEDVHAI